MEVIYLFVFFSWYAGRRAGVDFEMQTLPQASMEQCQQNGAALKKFYPDEIKFACIEGLAEGSGTPISPEELMSRYGFKDSTY